MYAAHVKEPGAATVARLAAQYKVRQQRVAAIVTLKQARLARASAAPLTRPQLERARAAAGRPLATELAAEFEKYSGACAVGTGEQFSAVTPTFPEFEVVHDDLPPHQVPADGRGTQGDASAAAEAENVAEFSEALRRNATCLGLLGPDAPGARLWRRSRVHDSPRRPAEGWSLVVTPLGGGGPGKPGLEARRRAAAYVAQPGGQRRPLNADEAELLYRQRVRPRRRLE